MGFDARTRFWITQVVTPPSPADSGTTMEVNSATAIGVTLDATTAPAAIGAYGRFRNLSVSAVAMNGFMHATFFSIPGIGQHFLQAVELGDGVSNNTFGGTSAFLHALSADLWL